MVQTARILDGEVNFLYSNCPDRYDRVMHCIQALIGISATIHTATPLGGTADIVELPDGFAALPLAKEFISKIAKNHPVNETNMRLMDEYAKVGCPEGDVWDSFMSFDLLQVAADLSCLSGIAYIETQYWGGEGYQLAMAWCDGSANYGPIKSEQPGAINGALRLIGVQKGKAFDEFDALGLARFRSMKAFCGK